MKRVLFVLAMSIIGVAIGILASLMLIAFIPVCGENCAQERFGIVLLCIVSGLVLFLIAAILFSRRSIPVLKQVLLGCVIMSLFILVPAFGYYVYKLHSEYIMIKAVAPVKPTTDFFHMVITTREVQGFTDARYEPVKPLTKIPQWERCLIGTARCDTSPRQVEVLCKGGVVHINETDWPAFALIPQENSAGVKAIKSMRLCN